MNIRALMGGGALLLFLIPVTLVGTAWGEESKSNVNACQDEMIKNQVRTAVSMLETLHGKVMKKEMTMKQAQKLGAELLRNLRYGDKRDGYFWADTTEGVNVVLYGRKDVEGKNRYGANSKGVFYIKEFIAKGSQPDGGYTDYWFTRMGGTEILPKRAYTLLFKPFGWIVGTGYYPGKKFAESSAQ